MGRSRLAPGGPVQHVVNRGANRRQIFSCDDDDARFERLVERTVFVRRMRVCAHALMPNHFHFVARAENDGDLSRFMQDLTAARARLWRDSNGSVGLGAAHEGRHRAFPVQDDDHFLRACRSVERDPVAAGLVKSAADGRWSSLGRRIEGDTKSNGWLISDWPVPRGDDWLATGDAGPRPWELAAWSESLESGAPLGDAELARHALEPLERLPRPMGRSRRVGSELTSSGVREVSTIARRACSEPMTC